MSLAKDSEGIKKLNQYVNGVLKKNILNCKNGILGIKRFVSDLKRDDLNFDGDIVSDIYNFAKKYCVHVKGDLVGKPYILEPFQIYILGNIFAWKKLDGTRRFKKGFVFMARGNAKTDMAAIAILYELFKSGKIGQEIVSLATTKDQSAIVWERARDMIKKNSTLKKYIHVQESRYIIQKNKGSSSGRFKALASKSDTLDGIRMTLAVLDEIHAYKDRNLFDVCKSSQGTMQNTFLLMITTAGYLTIGLCVDEYNYAVKILHKKVIADEEFVFIAELDKESEWKDPTMYGKTHPNLGKSVILETLIEDRDKALVDTESKKGFLVKYCNLFMNSDRKHFDYQLLKENNKVVNFDDYKHLNWWGGVDLSERIDLTSATLAAKDEEGNLLIINKNFIPERQVGNKEKYDRMKVLSWKESGWLDVCSGNAVDYSYVHNFFNRLRDDGFNIRGIGFDRFGAIEISEEMENDGYEVFDIAQGTVTMDGPMREFEILMLDKKLITNNNELFNWATSNVVVMRDSNGNIKPDKSKVGRSSGDRIDPFDSLMDALYLILKFKNSKNEDLSWLETEDNIFM